MSLAFPKQNILLSLSFWWFSLSQFFSLDVVMACALAKAFALSAIIWLGVIGFKHTFYQAT